MDGTPQDGTVRHRVVGSDGKELEPEVIGTVSVHSLGEKRAEKREDNDADKRVTERETDRPARQRRK
jgi:hypothetical protein